MKISTEQTERLFRFTREHFVEWYDLQLELVDHLANGIEAQWQENSTILFEEALQVEFKKFGVFGFMDVVEKRQGAMTKRYNKLVWKHFREFFGVPKIIFTVVAIAITFVILKNMPHSETLYIIVCGLIVSLSFYQIFKMGRLQKRKIKTDKKRWLFEEIIRSFGSSTIFSIVPVQVVIHFGHSSDRLFTSDLSIIIASVLIVFYAIATYIMLKVIPAKAEEYLLETYPEYRYEKL